MLISTEKNKQVLKKWVYFKCFRNRSTKTKIGKEQQTASLKEEAAAALWWEALRDAPSTALRGSGRRG